jgi:DNA invertase Pin-like site-specific DNA recombinase
VIDDPSIDTTSRTGKLVMGILALIAEFENDIRRERQTDGIKRAKEQGKKFGRKPVLTLPPCDRGSQDLAGRRHHRSRDHAADQSQQGQRLSRPGRLGGCHELAQVLFLAAMALPLVFVLWDTARRR